MAWPWSQEKRQVRKLQRAVRSLSASFDASSFGRLLKDWNPSGSGANSAMLGGLHTMRNRCRDMARNNEWCASALDSLVANVTDPGIMPISKSEDADFRANMRQLWADWGEVADAHGVLSWDLMVGLAFRSMCESGEVFIRLRSRRTEDGLPVPMQVQIIEADHVPADYTQNAPNGNRIIAGIEFDKLGRRVAYWMYPEHPGEAVIQYGTSVLPVRVPASEVIHLFDPQRPGQVRGYPRLVPVLVRLRNLAKYEDAELVKKMVSSLLVGVVTSPAPDADMLGDEETPEETGEADEGANWVNMQAGTFTVLQPGEDVKFSSPPAGDTNYEPHVKMHLRAFAAVWGLTYEQVTGDLTGVNFSSIRAGLNEFQRRARRQQRLLIHQLCRPVFQRWLNEAVMAGAISAPGYATAPADYARVDWRAPGWKYVNPQQEIMATKEEIKAGLKSRQQVAAEQGQDITEIDRQIADDYERSKGLGLIFDTDPDGIDQRNESTTVTDTVDGGTDNARGLEPDAAPSPDVSQLALRAALESVRISAEGGAELADEVESIIGDAK